MVNVWVLEVKARAPVALVNEELLSSQGMIKGVK